MKIYSKVILIIIITTLFCVVIFFNNQSITGLAIKEDKDIKENKKLPENCVVYGNKTYCKLASNVQLNEGVNELNLTLYNKKPKKEK